MDDQISLDPALKLFDGADNLLTAWESWQAKPAAPRHVLKVREEIRKVQKLLDICKSLTVN